MLSHINNTKSRILFVSISRKSTLIYSPSWWFISGRFPISVQYPTHVLRAFIGFRSERNLFIFVFVERFDDLFAFWIAWPLSFGIDMGWERRGTSFRASYFIGISADNAKIIYRFRWWTIIEMIQPCVMSKSNTNTVKRTWVMTNSLVWSVVRANVQVRPVFWPIFEAWLSRWTSSSIHRRSCDE